MADKGVIFSFILLILSPQLAGVCDRFGKFALHPIRQVIYGVDYSAPELPKGWASADRDVF